MMKNRIYETGVATVLFASSVFGGGISDAEFYKYTNYDPDAKSAEVKFDDFANPSGDARVQTWWHWINANVSREGIDRDLEAMSKNNYGAAIIFNLGSSISPLGKLAFGTPEWFDTFKYVVEKGRQYGVDIGIHNCDGWSEAAGPWISPELSMKILTISKTRAKGDGSVQTFKLKTPAKICNFYRDIAVVAYPAFRPLEIAVANRVKSVKPATDETLPMRDSDIKAMLDDNPKSYLKIAAKNASFKQFGADFELDAPFEASAIYLDLEWTWRPPAGMWLAVSDDGKNFKKICDLDFKGLFCGYFKFPSATAKYWRIVRDRTGENFQQLINIKTLELLPTGKMPKMASYITDMTSKVALARNNRAIVYRDDEIPPEAVISPKNVKIFENALKDDGSFEWKVPEGEWEIIRVGYTSNGRRNHPASKSGIGLETDKLSRKATEVHFDSYIKKMIDASGENAGKVFKYIETDSWECGQQNWTNDMRADFKKINGYDILPWLPAMLGEVVESGKATEKFASDLRYTTKTLVMRNFYGRLGELIRARGIKYETEPLSESSLCDKIMNFKMADVPQDEIWQHYRNLKSDAVPSGNRSNAVSSASHFFGKKLTTCESLTQNQGNWADAPLALKGISDTILLSGMNVLVFHSFTHQPDERVPGWQMEPWGSCINRKMPWFQVGRDFFQYLARCQYMLQQGRADSTFACTAGDEVPVRVHRMGDSGSLDYDMINPDCVRNYLRVENGKLVSPGKIRYSFICMDKNGVFGVETLSAIKKLVENGGVFCGEKPSVWRTFRGGSRAKAQWEKLCVEIFGDGSKSVRKIGKGKMYVGYSPAEVGRELGEKPHFAMSSNDPRFKTATYKRVHADGSAWFFVANSSRTESTFKASFDVLGKIPEIWNPETGERTVVSVYSEENGYTSLPLSLKKNDSVFVVFKDKKPAASVVKYSVDGVEVFPKSSTKSVRADAPKLSLENGALSVEFFAKGTVEAELSDGSKKTVSCKKVRAGIPFKTPFNVAFQSKYDAPESASFDKFESWTENSDERVKNYSGIGVYTLKIDLPALAENERAYVSFGKVMEIGRVSVNGKFVGSMWKSPYSLDITKFARAGENTVKVEVGNTWVNRCLYDSTLPADKRITWANTMQFHFPAKDQRKIFVQGRDCAWAQGLIPSGIIGSAEVKFGRVER